MKRRLPSIATAFFLLLNLAACNNDSDSAQTTSAGSPVAGMAEGYGDFPVGAPLGGYTGRCKCFGNGGFYDQRQGAYHEQFNPSIGVQTQPKIVALWLENGDQDLVLLKTDAIYTFEGLVTALERRLGEATGRDLAGKVVLASNHTHAAPSNFDQGVTWYLGGDVFNREIFERAVDSMQRVALAAWDERVPAAIGIGQAKDWDPNDRVYSDRRPENNERVFFEDIPAGRYKDPYLSVLRIDTADGDPMGLFFAFGMHGTVASESNQLWSVESGGHVEAYVEEKFDEPVVVGYLQHGGGDASPRGVDRSFARMESLGEIAADSILELWSQTTTSTAPIELETVTRSIDTARDKIQVQREQGTLSYPAFVAGGSRGDGVLFDDQDRLVTPLDEFNFEYGAAFCGASPATPYNSCADVGTLSSLVIRQFFRLPSVELPLPETLRAKTSATRLGPVPFRRPDGETVNEDVLLAFFPGEATATYTEQFRRRAAAELGMEYALPFAYAQDHQGYLLIPEDWLSGGYEPSINLWGPLQAEHIMEGLLTGAAEILTTTEIEPHDPNGLYSDVEYPHVDLPGKAPDLTPNAGTALTALPDYFLVPIEGLQAEVAPPATVRRAQDIVQFMWEGGDPGVDLPEVVLERQVDGEWQEAKTAAGRPITSAMHDILLATTPDPLSPWDAEQRHYWWLAWQAVGHAADRLGLPLGEYRLHVYGHKYAGGASQWPWPAEPYELTSPPFEVVPAVIDLALEGNTLRGWIDAPALGFRLIDLEGSSRGRNPVRGATIEVLIAAATTREIEPVSSRVVDGQTEWELTGAQAIAPEFYVTDAYGNRGVLFF